MNMGYIEENSGDSCTEALEGVSIRRIIEGQNQFFASGKTLSADFRRKQLKALRCALKAYETMLLEALEEDLGKVAYEGYATELGMVREELRFTLAHFTEWMKPVRARTPLAQFPSKAVIYKEPLGTVLIFSPWNYPVNLSLTPLISSIAAGNCTIIKPSRSAPATSAALGEMLEDYFNPDYIALIKGRDGTNQALLEQDFGHIFFTGSPEVGKQVMEAAARRLIPVTLELGGKSPCIVDKSAKIDLAARRIVWGKCINGGQTCVAPDYVLVDETVKEPLLEAMVRYIKAFYGEEPLYSKDLPHIVNEKHFYRLIGLMEGQEIYFGGQYDAAQRKIAPTILLHPSPDSLAMQEEIFGPILPVISYSQFDDALEFIKGKEKPLAFYLFSSNRSCGKKAIKTLSFGGGCINDTIIHLANPRLPFGGVGGSGMGAYHGKKGFQAFTHEKGIMKKSNRIDIPLRYPPYEGSGKLLRLFLR